MLSMKLEVFNFIPRQRYNSYVCKNVSQICKTPAYVNKNVCITFCFGRCKIAILAFIRYNVILLNKNKHYFT